MPIIGGAKCIVPPPTKILGGPWPTRLTLQRPHDRQLKISMICLAELFRQSDRQTSDSTVLRYMHSIAR